MDAVLIDHDDTFADEQMRAARGWLLSRADELRDRPARSARAELAQIDRAMTQLDEGTYALCQVCGEQIDAQRLTALRYATECRKCAREG